MTCINHRIIEAERGDFSKTTQFSLETDGRIVQNVFSNLLWTFLR